jgi:DNA polymerase (family 10)
MRHPVVRILAHPTGRRIGIRPGVELDVEAVIAAAVDHDVALEVNGHRDRLDLSADLAKVALSAGAMLAANSDAHRTGELGNVANSVGTLQRAGVPPASVVNTLPVTRFRDWISGGARFPTR